MPSSDAFQTAADLTPGSPPNLAPSGTAVPSVQGPGFRASKVAPLSVDWQMILDDAARTPAAAALPELLREELLHELFEATAAAHPARIAVHESDQRITYAELDRCANQLARYLRAQGIGRGDCVGLLLPRSTSVYVALLGILKAGAAYVPLDPDYPADRIAYILADCGVRLLITGSGEITSCPQYTGQRLLIDSDWSQVATLSGERLLRDEVRLAPDDLCYVIYTSGSTGQPKGVQIEHRNVCHLVRAEGQLFRVAPDDRVYQGFSIAFDASVEEVWLAFFAGATLVVGTREMVRSGAALAQRLTEAGVTVLSCVPTLLAMLEDDLPTVRLLILGGEVCPTELVARWLQPGRRVVNTYGPTEATVIATWAECRAHQSVTIGRTLPNYSAFILDEQRRPVPPGMPGELYLGGVGLARGYVNLPDLTRDRFIDDLLDSGGRALRLYRTGDRVLLTTAGDIEFLGRVDEQVKIRGFRVELTEIEAALVALPDVQAATVVLQDDGRRIPQLVGFVVVAERPVDVDALRAQLLTQLPAYMVPSRLETLDALPLLTSGKVDRKQLAARLPTRTAAPATQPTEAPRNPLERRLWEVWSELFFPQPVELDDDFFVVLGGHSLLAARMVSQLRRESSFQSLSMLDVYQHPTIEGLAAAQLARLETQFDSSAAESAVLTQDPVVPKQGATSPSSDPRRGIGLRHFFCGIAQAVSMYFILGLFSAQWLAPYLTYSWLHDEELPVAEAALGALASLIIVYPLMLLVVLAAKWTIVGRFKAGRYPLWGVYYFRWWFVHTLMNSVPLDYLSGTPLLGWFYRLLGARIGSNVHLGSPQSSACDLLFIGADSTIGADARLATSTVQDGQLILAPMVVGERCFVGVRANVSLGARLDDDARLEDLSLLPEGSTIPTGETWHGSPARPGISHARPSGAPRPAVRKRFALGLAQGIGVLVFPVLVIGAMFPGVMLMTHLNAIDEYYYYLVLSPLVAVSFVVFLCLEIAAVKWLLLGRVRPGTYDLHSRFYFCKWFVDQLLGLSQEIVGPLYSTIYLAPWYRLLGARLGKRAEISTASFISPDLLSIDDEGFIADSVSLGAARVEAGKLSIGTTHVGKRSFIGNSAHLPPGTSIADNCLIGCLSTIPIEPASIPAGSSWLGSPAFFLPQRQQSHAFSEQSTFAPTRWLWLQRASIEFVRITLPSTCFIALTNVLLSAVILLREELEMWELVLLFPVLYALVGMAAAATVIGLKWLLMGRYQPCERPLWSTFVWRTELITAMHEHLADLFITSQLEGTPFLPWFFRLLGCKIGKRVYMETTCLTEFDLIEIGDDVCLNGEATVQTHLFEDRVMKMSHIRIGDGCSVGSLSLVLYDTQMEAGSSLDDLSLLMKREMLPKNTRWRGIPAQPVIDSTTALNHP